LDPYWLVMESMMLAEDTMGWVEDCDEVKFWMDHRF
jgi:hypothetical protein